MAKKQTNTNVQVSFGIQGMERQAFHHLIDEKIFTFQRNGNIETDSESIALTNEHSNLLCSRFKPGYMVIGVKYDSLNSKIWFFITEKKSNNEGKRKSEIGFIKINNTITDESDLELECGCDMISILSKPLEDSEQIEYCSYTTLIGDDCNNCLNFDPNYPIYDIILKQEACGYTMTFASKNNPPRYIIVDKIDYYRYKGDINCGEDNTEDTCLDCDKLRLFPQYDRPFIIPKSINYGGNLKRGTYEYYIAYCDKQGNELTSYLTSTNTISIFDENNMQFDQTNRNETTNNSIKLTVENLDKRFNFYKIVVIERTDINETTSVYVEGIHSIVDTNITHTTSGVQNGERISLNRLFVEKPVYKNFGGLMTSNGYLFAYDYEVEKEWNLQPIVNLLGSFVKWQTVEASEDLYKDGVNTSLYKSFMRDEVYPLGIKFNTSDGYDTALFPLIARPPMSSDIVRHDSDFNRDVRSVMENQKQCQTTDRNYKWQFYNTASILGYSPNNILDNRNIIDKSIEHQCVQENIKEYDNITLEFKIDDDFTNLLEWVNENNEDICDTSNTDYYNETLCEILTDNTTEDCNIENATSFLICDDYDDCYAKYCDINSEDYNYDKCVIIERNCIDGDCTGICFDFEEMDSEINITSVEGETIELVEKTYPWLTGDNKYKHNYSKTQCYIDNISNNINLDGILFFGNDDEETEREAFSFSENGINIKDTPAISDNTVCENPAQLPSLSQSINSEITGYIKIEEDRIICDDERWHTFIVLDSKERYKSYYDQSVAPVTTMDTLMTDIEAPSVPGFQVRVSKTAMWYEFTFENETDNILEITPIVPNGNCYDDLTIGDGMIRYIIYDNCDNLNILDYGSYNANDGLFLNLKKSIFNKNKILISLETRIINHYEDHNRNVKRQCKLRRKFNNYFIIATTICGCFDVVIRDKEYYKAKVTVDNLKVSKTTNYNSKCKFNATRDDDCGVNPDRYGTFSYWESEEIYPDNNDLYNSSNVKLNLSKLRSSKTNENTNIINMFENYYSEGVDIDGNIIFKTENGKSKSNFTCEAIRHFKFPDNSIIPFMSTETTVDFNKSKIYPIGVTINENTVNVFLDAAVESGLITIDERKRITGYEIFRGNRSVNKSVIFKGIANDMYEDTREIEKGQRTFFRNFPYNTLGKNSFITQDEERKNLLNHPFTLSSKNNRFSLISPEVYYDRPNTPSEMVIDGFMYGKSVSNFVDVKDHSEWVILGEKAYALADKLAKAEIVLEAALNIATLTMESSKNYWFTVGVANTGGNPIGAAVSIAALAIYSGIQIINLLTVKLPKLKTQWLEIFEQRGSVYNFASMQVSSKGFYNTFKPQIEKGDKLRGLVTSKYLSNGLDAITEVESDKANVVLINNKDRENSLYLYTGEKYPVNYPRDYVRYDNYDTSPNSASRYLPKGNSIVNLKNIASPYFSMKAYVPSQYGKIDEVEWISLNHDGRLKDDESKNIFGGDTFISRVDLKNKFKFFNKNAVDLANRTPFKYSKASNIAYTKYYVDHKSADEKNALVNDMPYLSSQYNLNNREGGKKFYEGDPSKFYLFSYGIPYFLIESEINSNFRNVGKESHEQFASRGLNVEEWVQEKNTSIAQNNIFYYNNVYSRNQTGIKKRILPATYDREKWDCLSRSENGVAWSEPDNSEVSLSDPWLVFRPFNIYRFPFSYGKLISLNAIESVQVMGRFSDNVAVFNAIDIIRDRLTPENEELGSGGIFAERPVEFSDETGSQNKSMVSNEFGHFWADAKRGKVFQLQPNAKGLSVISDFKTKGDESGMRKWFKRHLPFKILKSGVINLTETDIDNPFKGLGILMWWDSRFKRVFITKKDYIIKTAYKNKLYFESGKFFIQGNPEEIELTNPEYFKDVSWTISYSPIYQSWLSYYDFKPNYAVGLNDYFQTGINYSVDESEEGIWSHLITNKSYQVFYGKYYPWKISIPIKNTYTNNVLQDLKIWTISQRYHNNNDYAVWRKKSFNKIIIHNQTNNSGLLHLNYDDSINKSKYPIKMNNIEQGIQATHSENHVSLNYFYNRVKNTDNHIPIWNYDENEINNELNPNAVSFNSKKILERMRGDWFMVDLIVDHSSQFKSYFKWLISKEQGY